MYNVQVWAVLKPGFVALLDDPFETELLDIIVFNLLPSAQGKGGSPIYLANQVNDRAPSFEVKTSSLISSLPAKILVLR